MAEHRERCRVKDVVGHHERVLADLLELRALGAAQLVARHDEPVGWCQCTSLRRMAWRARVGDGDDDVPAIACMVLAPQVRGRGLARVLLETVLERLREDGASRVIVLGHRPEAYEDPDSFLELPAGLCEAAGLRLLADHEVCPIYATP